MFLPIYRVSKYLLFCNWKFLGFKILSNFYQNFIVSNKIYIFDFSRNVFYRI